MGVGRGGGDKCVWGGVYGSRIVRIKTRRYGKEKNGGAGAEVYLQTERDCQIEH